MGYGVEGIMAVYSYQAVDRDNGAITGTVVADTPRQARDTLRARGLTIQQVTTVDGTRSGIGGVGLLRRWSTTLPYRRRAEVVDIIRELSTLLGAGIPLLEALDTIAQQHGGLLRTSILLLRDRVAEGLSLADAMRQQPQAYDELTINIVDVGETAGALDVVLDQLAQYQEQALQFRNRVLSAILYPSIVLTAGVGVCLFLMTYVVPNILSTLIEAGRPLPLMTRIVKSVSDFLMQYWWVLGLLTIGVGISITIASRTAAGRFGLHRLQLRLPIMGSLFRKQAIMRIALVIATLMRTGITFVRSIQIARNTAHNQVIASALARCEIAVAAGQDIGEALRQTRAFPPMVVQIFTVGQQSGRLEDMLSRLAIDYERQIASATGRLAATLEPLLIILLAIIVGCIAFATILPILEAGNVLQ